MQNLLDENTGLVWLMMTQTRPGHLNIDDLFQEGRIALWQSILHFDPTHGTAFSTYACAAIRNRLWLAVKRSLESIGWLPWEEEMESLEGIIAAWQSEQVHLALEEALETLPEGLRLILMRHYGLDGNTPLSFTEIGLTLGWSHEWVRQLENHALLLLRQPLSSLRLRTICEKSGRRDYRQALRQNQDWQRRGRA